MSNPLNMADMATAVAAGVRAANAPTPPFASASKWASASSDAGQSRDEQNQTTASYIQQTARVQRTLRGRLNAANLDRATADELFRRLSATWDDMITDNQNTDEPVPAPTASEWDTMIAAEQAKL